jgi:hypothetical protein
VAGGVPTIVPRHQRGFLLGSARVASPVDALMFFEKLSEKLLSGHF